MHVKIIAFQLPLFCKHYQNCPLYNKQKNTWMLGNTRFISRVEHDISLGNSPNPEVDLFNTYNHLNGNQSACRIFNNHICRNILKQININTAVEFGLGLDLGFG
jgi:hypothetical protein